MKLAHIILAHKSPDQVENLIYLLENPETDIYLHIDLKTDQKQFDYLRSKKNVHFISKRVNISWAGYGTIQATLNGFNEVRTKGYDYINVISGQDLPLKKQAAFISFLEKNQPAEYITCEPIKTVWTEAAPRVNKYHLINYHFPGKHRIELLINKILPARKFPYAFEIVGRANWFTITGAAANYILEFSLKNRKYNSYFKFCWGADEFYFSTILYNSDFRSKIRENLVFVDWTGKKDGHPRVLEFKDLEILKKSDKFFARKFDIVHDPAIIAAISSISGS